MKKGGSVPLPSETAQTRLLVLCILKAPLSVNHRSCTDWYVLVNPLCKSIRNTGTALGGRRTETDRTDFGIGGAQLHHPRMDGIGFVSPEISHPPAITVHKFRFIFLAAYFCHPIFGIAELNTSVRLPAAQMWRSLCLAGQSSWILLIMRSRHQNAPDTACGW